MFLIVTKSLADCVFSEMAATIYISHSICSFYNVIDIPPTERQDLYSFHWNWASLRLPLPTDQKKFLRLSQTKETASTCLSISRHSPLEPSHHAANKAKLVHAERPRGDTQMERQLVPTASWVREPLMIPAPSFMSCTWYDPGNMEWEPSPAVSCPNLLPTEFESVINVYFTPLNFG